MKNAKSRNLANLKTHIARLFEALWLALPLAHSAWAQTTAFTYQGQLTLNGSPVNGNYDLVFSLCDAAAGSSRWLEIGARPAGGGAFATLGPRHPLTPAPYALYAPSAGVATFANNVTQNAILRGQALLMGLNNTSTSGTATIAGGANNTADGAYCSVGGGFQNTAAGNSVAIAGGSGNWGIGDYVTVAGGGNNAAGGPYDSIGGGFQNTASRISASIGGGSGNRAQGDYAPVAGGENNSAVGPHAFVGGGGGNSAMTYDVVVGGLDNSVSADLSGIGSGKGNQVSGLASWIGGGQRNSALANYCVTGGGYFNTNLSIYGTVSGGQSNIIGPSSLSATIAGGQQNGIGSNAIACAICGGRFNIIQAWAETSTIAGGEDNKVEADDGTVGGGAYNTIQSAADGSTVGGGANNTIQAGAICATIPGGEGNVAADHCFAAGQQAQALHRGSFVWADSQFAPFASTASNQFSIRAAGGVRLNADTSLFFGNTGKAALSPDQGGSIKLGDPTSPIFTTPYIDFHHGINPGSEDYDVRIINDAEQILTILRYGSATPMAQFSPGGLAVNGSVCCSSDRNQKENLQPVDAGEVLAKVAALPLTKWNYRDDTRSNGLGPMSQDFYAAFGLGPDDKHIATVDADGVALAAIQALNKKLQDQEATIGQLKRQLEQLEQKLSANPDQISH